MSKKKGSGPPPKMGRQPDGSYRCRDGIYVTSLREMFEHDRMSGKQHSLADETRDAYSSRLGQMMDYLQFSKGIHSYDHITTDHLLNYVKHLDNVPSQKTDSGLSLHTIHNIAASIRWFSGREGIDFPATNAELHLRSRDRATDEFKPFRFPNGWLETRAAFQERLEAVANWVGCAGQLGLAFGLRSKERLLSNTTLTVEKGTNLLGPYERYTLSVAGRPPVEVTREELTSKQMYKASFAKRLDRLEDGKEYLIVRFAKGGRVRAQVIYNEERRAAVERMQELCRANETPLVKDGNPPTIVPYDAFDKPMINEKGQVSKNFLTTAREFMKNTYTKLEGTIENMLNTNADRHWDTQTIMCLLKDGSDARANDVAWQEWLDRKDTDPDFRKEHESDFMFTKEDCIEERGHSDDRKLEHYAEAWR